MADQSPVPKPKKMAEESLKNERLKILNGLANI